MLAAWWYEIQSIKICSHTREEKIKNDNDEEHNNKTYEYFSKYAVVVDSKSRIRKYFLKR